MSPGGPLMLLGSNPLDRKSTRLNSSHSQISYAVFCLKKKSRSHSLPLVGASAPHPRITTVYALAGNTPLIADHYPSPHPAAPFDALSGSNATRPTVP